MLDRHNRSGLPYKILAGVEPVSGGWLVVPGNLQGVNLAPQEAFVVPALADVLDYRPSYSVVAIHTPIGAMDKPGQKRSCDLEARRRLGQRAGAASSAPARAVLDAPDYQSALLINPKLTPVSWSRMTKAREAFKEIQSWRQQTVFEVNPELAFMTMNEGEPIPFTRRSPEGRAMRKRLVMEKLPGTAGILARRPRGVREEKLVDALADLWTSRRIMARAITRAAEEPEWDDAGVRMDIVS